jgi:hypothetical protein
VEELNAQIKTVTDAPIKHVYDSISIKSTQEIGLAVLDNGGSLAIVLPAAVTSTEKTVFQVTGWHRKPSNLPLTESFYHDIVKDFFEKGILKVSYPYRRLCWFSHWNMRTISQMPLKFFRRVFVVFLTV